MARRGIRFSDQMTGIGDLTLLGELTVDTVLSNLKERYENDNIYTRCGDVLLSVNPFKPLTIYSQEYHDKYKADTPRSDLDPHVFQVAATAFHRLQSMGKSQVVIITGESGAGKTENMKYMVKHLMQISGDGSGDLHHRILQVNPLLEAFGNARTALNNNSSRFAKYLQLEFAQDGAVRGASVSDYMLEKSRVVHQSRGDGNFHIFYNFLAGITDTDREVLSIRRENTFRIVDLSSTVLTHEFTEQFQQYIHILQHLGLTDEELDNMKGILAAILHMTNVEFYEDTKTEVMQVTNEIPLNIVVDILEVDENVLASALVTKKIRVAGEDIDTVRTKAEAEGTRDSLAKALYERLFGWIVRKVNDSLKQDMAGPQCAGSIDMLDICGFESLHVNSFEQMCINLVNEKIQGHMNWLIFKSEKEIYQKEGVELTVSESAYNNNDDIIDMFLGRRAILDLIDEDTNLRQATEKTMVMKLDQKYKNVESFKALPGSGLEFRIKHFAGEVKYTAYKFLEKNRDSLSPELVQCLKKSDNLMVADLFLVNKGNTGTISETAYNYRASRKRPAPRPPGIQRDLKLTASIVAGLRQSMKKRFGGMQSGEEFQSRQSQTAIEYFKNSLDDLMKKMKYCEQAFVRCIKPNTGLQPDQFDSRYVEKQLRYNGIAEVARIRKEGWPIRRSYTDFLPRFKLLTGSKLADKSVTSSSKAAEIIMQSARVQPVHYRLGNKMIFMKEETLHKLDTLLMRKREEEQRKREEEERKRIEAEKEKLRQIERERLNTQARGTLTPIGEEESGSSCQYTSSGSSSASYASSPPPYTPQENGSKRTGHQTREPHSGVSDQPPDLPPRGQKKETNFWDIFRVVDTEVPRKDAYDQMTFKVLKVFTYIFLFLVFLGSCLSQRLGLMLLVSVLPSSQNGSACGLNSKMEDEECDAHFFFLAIAICIPYVLTSLWSFMKWLFGSFPNPSLLTWIVVFVQEALHSFGLSVLVFWVLPKYDMIFGALLLSATIILPSFLSICCASGKITGDVLPKIVFKKVLDIVALVLQLSAIPLLLLRKELVKLRFSIPDNSAAWDIVMLVVAFVCTSMTHWENFVDGKVERLSINGGVKKENYNSFFMNKLLKVRYELQYGRHCVAILSGILKIIITFTTMYFVMVSRNGKTNSDIDSMFDALSLFYKEPLKFSPLLMVTIGAFVAYCVSYIACRLQMQIVCFSVPLLLFTPITYGLLAMDCFWSHILGYVAVYDPTCQCNDGNCYNYLLGIAWFVSLMWITRHVWAPKQGRLEEYDRLFFNPFYCGILLPERLLLNRRRHKESVVMFEEEIDEHQSKDHYFIVNPNAEENGIINKKWNDDEDDDDLPFIYACATMWHETKIEMTQLMKSIFRLDYDRHKREECAIIMKSNDTRDRYNFQAHIFFDDALELGEDDRFHANSFVKTLISVMNDACSAVHRRYMEVHPPYKVITPYGCQLIWEMPGGCLLYVHVKDKNKIRHRKRWSQVMYMYYLLGYQLLKDSSQSVLRKFNESNQLNSEAIDEMFNIDVQRKTKNTFLLALDGDTDFSPGSVRVLLDRMTNDKVAAVCGRIHPIGSGPLVWYQMFEYAVGHWLQKATEHVLGCVLCSPGCFSLFRASALMDNNVMRKYTTFPTEPTHFLQYDQGEDRWLCTLLLQQGYRVDYAAAADAYTYAPEGFNEFFNQRRRWTPSTLANILDLLSSSNSTIARNPNISYLYIMYQIAMMFGTVLGPGTVIMMIAGAIATVFDLTLLWSYVLSLIMPTVYLVVCFTTSSKIQLIVGAVFSALYSFIMMSVIAGTVVTATTMSPLHPSVIFTCLLFFMFVFAGFIHWKEINCLPYLSIYFLCIPSGYLLLVIYSLCNLNNVSWGTREVPRRKSKKELAAEKKAEAQKKKEKKKDGLLARLFFNSSYVKELKTFLEKMKPKLLPQRGVENRQMVMILNEMNENIAKLAGTSVKTVAADPLPVQRSGSTVADVKPEEEAEATEEESVISEDEDAENQRDPDPYAGKHWAYDAFLGSGPVMTLCEDEDTFWKTFIDKYLKPIDKDEQREKQIKDGLIELKNNACFAMIMLNMLWIALNFMFQYKEAAAVTLTYVVNGETHKIPISILGLLFIAFFTILIIIQFFGMLIHRYETFLHLLSMTKLSQSETEREEWNMKREKDRVLSRLMGIVEPPVDYEEDDEAIGRIEAIVKGGQTGRDLARSQRQDLSQTSKRLDRFPNLKSTLLRTGFHGLNNAAGRVGNEAGMNTLRVKFNMTDDQDSGLRNRYYKPALKPIVERLADTVTHNRVESRPDYDEDIYQEIRQCLPTRMGRDFARNYSRMAKNPERNGRMNDHIIDTTQL